MEWFKHSTGSHDDPDISDAIDEFGPAGYSTFFIALEIYGQEFNHLDSEGWLTLSRRFVARKLRLSQTKVELILNFYSERQRIILKTSKNTISINCPKFVDIASNWTKRKVSLPTEALQSPYVATTAKEEEEKKKRVEKKKNKEKDILPKKVKFLDSVYLADDEYQKLLAKYGKEQTDKAIEILNNGIMAKGYKYKSHYHAVIGWPMKESQGGNGNGSGRSYQAGPGQVNPKAGRAKSDGQPYPVDHEF